MTFTTKNKWLKILLSLFFLALMPFTALAAFNLNDVELTEGPYPLGQLTVSNRYIGYVNNLASAVYIINTTTSGDLTLQNLQVTPSGNVFIPGSCNFYISFTATNANLIPGRTKTVTVRIYNIIGQLVGQDSTVISVRQTIPLEPTSLALGGSVLANNGVYAVNTSGALSRFYWTGTQWERETIDTGNYSIAAGSLISGPQKVYGVTTTGRVFNTYVSGSDVLFGVLPDPADIQPGSLALSGTPGDNVGVFGVTNSGALVRFYWESSTWNRETIATGGNSIAADSLIPGSDRVFGVTTSGRVFNAYMNGGQITFGLLPSPADIATNSLAVGGTVSSNVGVFAVNTGGNLVRFYWSSSTWNRVTVNTQGYTIAAGSLVPGEYRVFGVTTNGNGFHTYLPGAQVGFSLLPGPADIEDESLAVSGTVDDNSGVFAVDGAGAMVRFLYYYGGGWDRETIFTSNYVMHPGSLTSGFHKIFAVSFYTGEICNTYISGGNVQFGLLEEAYCTTPAYEPNYWNDGGTIQYNNNCYNYANNKRTDTFAQPGRASGNMYSAINCQEVGDGAESDGLLPLPPSGVCPDGMTKVALVIWPNVDYHWYRQDSDGLWSHKPGGTQATNLDNSGNIITDPETCNTGYYTVFCGYFCTCSDVAQGQGHANII